MCNKIATALVLTSLGFVLAGCGYSTGDRAVSGGLIGAGAGAAVGAVTGGSTLTGALIGGGVGPSAVRSPVTTTSIWAVRSGADARSETAGKC